MNYKIFLFLCIGLAVGFNVEAKSCKKGQPCGNSCISWNKTCRIGTYSSNNYTSKSATRNPQQKYTSQNTINASYYEVTASKLNVREKPSSSNKVIGTLSKGQKVYVHLFASGWAMIQYESSFYWVSEKYLKKIS
ncbi:MAG: SH3 domain-containing protein [Shewanella sp.]